MKKLYLIGGTMGVGKTTISQELKHQLNNLVFLDGDWCWDSHPFIVNEETKEIVLDNICYILNNYIHSKSYEYVIFCWVMHEQDIINHIISRLDLSNTLLIPISLLVNEENLTKRLLDDIQANKRNQDIIEKSVQRLELYQSLNTIKIDTTNKTVQQIVEEIKTL
jgi:broad-specificity NMP kinase